MWLAYVDESFNRQYHYVTALLVRDEVVNATQRALRGVVESARDCDIAHDAELHGYDVFHGENDFAAMKEAVRGSVHRWHAEGQRELDRLSPEAHLALELGRARDRAQPQPDWHVTARNPGHPAGRVR
jgi:hypothetical protein